MFPRHICSAYAFFHVCSQEGAGLAFAEHKTEDVCVLIFYLVSHPPDQLYDGGGEGEAEHDVDGAEQHVHGSV